MGKIDLTIMLLLIQFAYHFSPLISTRFPKLTNIVGKRLSKHFIMQAWELFEDCLKHELLCESVCRDARKSDIVELGSFACQDVIVADIAGFALTHCNNDASTLEIWLVEILF